jgi:SET domain-containing protein
MRSQLPLLLLLLLLLLLCSCDGGNLEAVLVTMKGFMLPRVALFAARDIPAGQELTFAYCYAVANSMCDTDKTGDKTLQGSVQGPGNEFEGGTAGGSRRRCYCGTAACSGYLPSAL